MSAIDEMIDRAEREVQRKTIERRKSVIMRMAGNIAGGICADPSRSPYPEDIAKLAVEIAERIHAIVETHNS